MGTGALSGKGGKNQTLIAPFASLKFLRFLFSGDRLNPILLREMRQAVRNRTILVSIHIYLTVLVAACGFVIYDPAITVDSGTMGPRLFSILMGMATLTSLVGCFVFSVFRLAKDRIDEEMQFYSLIRPRTQLLGRLQAGLLITVLFFSMTLPFLVFTYLLRGVSPYQLTLLPLAAMLGIQVFNLLAVAFFAGVRSYLQGICYGVLFLVVLGVLYICFIGDFQYLYHWFVTARTGYTGSLSYTEVATELIFRGAPYLIIVPIVAVLLALCQLSPASWNRMMPLRIGLSIIGIVSLPLFHFFMPEHVQVWFYWTTALLAALLIIAVCERDTWQARLRLSIPRSLPGRLLAFPLFTGAANGLIFVLLWTVLLAVIASLYVFDAIGTIHLPAPLRHSYGYYYGYGYNDSWLSRYTLIPNMFFLMLVFDYFATGKILWQFRLWRYLPKELTWLVGAGMILAGCVVSLILAVLTPYSLVAGELNNTFVMALNPFMLFFDKQLTGVQMILAGAWTSLLVLCGYPWLKGRFLDFRPVFPTAAMDETTSPQEPCESPGRKPG